MPNRLAASTSPYLLQHAANPVDWYPWGEEAFDRARSEDKPVLLSVGYSSCHWCHVMAHESFEDSATADNIHRLEASLKELSPRAEVVHAESHNGGSSNCPPDWLNHVFPGSYGCRHLGIFRKSVCLGRIGKDIEDIRATHFVNAVKVGIAISLSLELGNALAPFVY